MRCTQAAVVGLAYLPDQRDMVVPFEYSHATQSQSSRRDEKHDTNGY